MSALVRAVGGGRHLPASHPVRQRMSFRAELEVGLERTPSTPTVSAVEHSDQSARIEDIAQRVVLMPDGPLTGQQRRSLLILARELYRRATVDHPITRS